LFTRECHNWRAGYSIARLGLVISLGVSCSEKNLQAIDARSANAEGGRIKGLELIQQLRYSIAAAGSSGFFFPARKGNSCSNLHS
jgi:hypothetical protein